jgi:LacI family transcriptional regulator
MKDLHIQHGVVKPFCDIVIVISTGDTMTEVADAPRRRTTLKDVALESGVTVSTVSKVVNNRPDVGAEVRRRVLETIETMGFRPNPVARGLRTQRSDTIAIVTDDLEGIFTTAMMRGVEDAASTAGMGVLLCNSYGERDREEQQLRRLLDRQIDALIFMSGNRVGPRPDPAIPIPADVPVAYLYEYGSAEIPAILPDDEGGARLAVEHLARSGAQRIAFLNGPQGWEATTDRLRGYEAGLTTLGRPLDNGMVAASPSWTPEDGYHVMNNLLDRRPQLDAVFCGSDDLAVGALAALRDRRIDVPAEVQVVGFDDRSLAVHQRPPLTTIALPLHEMGLRAGQLVLNGASTWLDAALPLPIERVPCTLIERESTR